MAEPALAPKDYPTGTVLFKAGDPSDDHMYIIREGKVQISIMAGSTEKVLATLGPGEFLGEMAVLLKQGRSATARVVENAKLIAIDSQTLETMLQQNTEVALRLMRRLAQRLQDTDDQLHNLLIKDTNSRVVHYLSRLAETKGQQVANGIKVPVTVNEIAEKLGLEPPKVDDLINKMVQAKIVSLEEGGIVVSSADKVRRFLEFLAMKEQFGDLF